MTELGPQHDRSAVDPQTLLDVVMDEHARDWAERMQLRALVKQQAARIAELEQAVRDAASPPAA